MTVASTLNRKTFTGDGVTLAFGTSPVTFFDTTDLDVYVVTTATGVAVLKTLTTDYSVTGGAGSTGTVTMLVAPASTETLVIVRTLPLTQETDLVNNDNSDAEVVEQSFDRATMIDQQLSARLDRALSIPDSDVAGTAVELPAAAARASQFIKFDAAGNVGVAAGLDGATGDLATNLAASTGSSLIGTIASGPGAVARPQQSKNRDWVSAEDYSGASVTAQLDAAIAANTPGVIIIPASMGAGEPTTVPPITVAMIDFRGSNITGSGNKVGYNFADANGHLRFVVFDDQTNPTISNAAVFGMHRPTGTLPANKTGEGAQFIGQCIGTINNSPSGYTLSGIEASVQIDSSGGAIPNAYGLTANATTATGTTNVTNLVSVYAQAPAKGGSGTITNAFSIVAEDPGSTGSTSNYSIYSKGPALFNGDINVTRLGVSSNSAFVSGSATLLYFVDIGTSGGKLRLGACGAANDFINGTVQNDVLIGNNGANTIWFSTNGNGQVKITNTASAVNYLSLTGGATGANASIKTTGENLLLGSGSALATTATAGYVLIPSCAGTPTGVPTGQGAGAIPMQFDTTGSKIWFYTGGAWKGVAVA